MKAAEEIKREEMYNADNETTREEMYKSNVSLPPAEGAEEQCQCCDGTGMCENIDGEKGACMTCNGSGKWKWPQPTAEGAEEILEKGWQKQFQYESDGWKFSHFHDTHLQWVIEAMQEFATLHAQKIAEDKK